ncbi:uncharacterized protein LOC130048817 [Ostrea edulis]|uniref:uncharacterized protein LOC130048817 n=1 Tax=Ostrea edulis TaxID=37623 RepID=UPI0024AF4405|nr:uncharacterized protein LOC130048817 [Ostrea edulis]
MATASFYIPVLKQVKISFRSFRSKLPNIEGEREETAVTETESVVTSKSEEIEMKVMGVNDASNASRIQLPHANSSEADIVQTNASSSETLNSTTPRGQDKPGDKNNTESKGGAKPKQGSVQRRLTVMFFVLILAYIISYIPPLVFLILTYSIEDFNFITLSKTEALAAKVYKFHYHCSKQLPLENLQWN